MLTPEQVAQILKSYTRDGQSMAQISAKYRLTRQRIWQILKQNRVPTQKAASGRRSVFCSTCGEEFQIHRSKWRRATALRQRFFCSKTCWMIMLELESSPVRQAFLRSWAETESGRVLPPTAVVHWEKPKDRRSQAHYVVFPTRKDHIQFHRGQDHVYLWKGVVRMVE